MKFLGESALKKLIALIKGDLASKADKAYVDAKVPDVTAADNDKFLRVVNGTPTWVALTNVAEEGA